MDAQKATSLPHEFSQREYGMTSQDAPAKPAYASDFRYWQYRILLGSMFGYASFYLVRQNFSMCIPALEAEFGYTKSDLGLILTAFAVIYGLGKAVSGTLSDRSNARYFMSVGLGLSALVCLLVGFSSSFWILFGLWVVNALFQSTGAPPCARLLTHWFSKKKLATRWAMWNASHQIGTAVIALLAGFLIVQYGWRSAFIIPALLALGSAIILFFLLRDTPESLGFPSIEKHTAILKNHPIPSEPSNVKLSFKEIMWDRVMKNRLVWYMCFANMFFYVLRMGLLNWAPTFLMESKGSSLLKASWQTALFDITAIFGGIVAGYLSDRVFEGRRGPAAVIFMVILMMLLLYLWMIPEGASVASTVVMAAIGFFVSGPQILQGVAAADFASKQAAGAANGLTGTFGYLGAAFSGVGVGYIVDHWGWNVAFLTFAGAALIGAFFFALTWNHGPEHVQNFDLKAAESNEPSNI